MAPPPSSLYTLSFALALLVTLFVAASLRLLAILPNARPSKAQLRGRPTTARVLVVLGSGGHTHEMFALLRDLDSRKYTHRTYVVSSGDAFSAQRAGAFEKALEERTARAQAGEEGSVAAEGGAPQIARNGRKETKRREERWHCVGPECYTIATIPRARRIHQPLYTTPFSALQTLLAAFHPLLGTSESDLPTLIITNGPATAVILILAAFILRFFNVRGAESRGLCRTVYVESFARVRTLSLSGKLLVRVVDRFLVQWEGLEGYAGRAEYCGILV
ncbi:glycosyltransferase family 1 protein [Macroventuria anomochaeta]|uniref:Glycosyltransferase family 1 protein n=1 Tax=Macroventuria anomochaeta TaxID=301207 RepID=A0ACB6RV30_9PLEO|nr:glycosyltransferase family 1 protein [Macroventuria anomochaeta]KAF2625624.1 glycosyltransferase family 1 protein [Macroventuria anomochaeta]